METYSLQVDIMQRQDLNTHEKCLGMCLAHAFDRKTQTVRRTRLWMEQATGMKGGTLRRALAGLVAKGVIVPKRTGRSTIYGFAAVLEKECGRVDGPHEDHQTVPERTIGESERRLMPVGSCVDPRSLDEFKRERGAKGKRKAVV